MTAHQTRQRHKRPDGRLHYVVGSTGSGKSTWTMQRVATASRLLVWDGKGEADRWASSARCVVVSTPSALASLVVPGASPSRIAYRVPVSRYAFDVFCKLAWVFIRSHGAPVVIEELADVTTPSKAPLPWGEICRKSRAFGSDVYALTQRPQEVDKTAQGNAALFHVGRMSDSLDAKYVARRLLGVETERVTALRPLEWLERDAHSGAVSSGRVNPKLRK